MKHFLLLLLSSIIIFILIITIVFAKYPKSSNESIGTYADSLMQLKYKPDDPGAVLLIAREGDPIFEKAYGMANIKSGRLNHTDNKFEIGSNTKQFTTVCILQLVQKGKLSLNDDLHKYFPWYNTHGRHITIENLLTHTSGIPDYPEEKGFLDIMKKNLSKESIMRWIMKDSLLFEPGTNWSYSNTGFFLLGMIIEKVTGMSYKDYVQQHILNPLHMNHSSVGTSKKIISGLVTGYVGAGKNKYKDAVHYPLSSIYSAGAIISDVEDLLKWDNALYTNKLVSGELLQKAWTSYTLKNGTKTGYGYGWFVTYYKGIKIIWHAGGLPGFLSVVIRMPKQQAYVALLSNNMSIHPLYIAMLIACKLAGKPLVKLPTFLHSRPESLKEYTGVYEVQNTGFRLNSNLTKEKMYEYVSHKGDTLFMQKSGGSKARLRKISKDAFIVYNKSKPDSLLYKIYHFIRDGSNHVSGLKVRNNLNISIVRTLPRTDLPLPETERKTISLSRKVLRQYAGKYRLKGLIDFNITVFTKDGKIYAQKGSQPAEIFPESKTKFYFKVIDATITFEKDQSGEVIGLILDQIGKHEFKKIK